MNFSRWDKPVAKISARVFWDFEKYFWITVGGSSSFSEKFNNSEDVTKSNVKIFVSPIIPYLSCDKLGRFEFEYWAS